MEFFNPILQLSQTLLPAVLWASIMTSLCLGLLYLVIKLIGDIVNPCLIYTLWLLLGVRMFLWTKPIEAMDFAGGVGRYVALIWLIGAAVFFIRFCMQHAFYYRNILEQETKLPEWLHSLFMEVREESKVRARPTLIVTKTTTEPLLMGTFRPVMVLPVELIKKENRESLRQVLRHEMAHLRSKDLWFAWLWTIAISLHWFNPLIWLARRSLGLWREIACDWRTTGLMSERERLEYGRTLLIVAQNGSGSKWSGAACIAEKTCDIERRITMISKKFPAIKKRIFYNISLATAAALFFLGTLCFPLYHESTAVAASEPTVNETPKATADKIPEKKLPVNKAPEIVKMEPKNGAKDVDPKKVTELCVTFDQDMGKGFSWCGGGAAYPEATGKPKWTDKRTCVFPVKLEPGKTYRLGINSPSFKNFRSAAGLPVKPVVYRFRTAGKPSIKAKEKGEPISPELLKSIRDKRAAISSADYSVKVINEIPSKRETTAYFRFQGENQWFVDISEIMKCEFQGGCDGKEEWSYIVVTKKPKHQSYKIRPLEEIQIRKVDLLDPFRCRKLPDAKLKSYCEKLTKEGYSYLGEKEIEKEKLLWFAATRKSKFGDSKFTIHIQIGLDPQTLLPSCTVVEMKHPEFHHKSKSKFQIHSVNQKYAASDFLAKNEVKVTPEKITEPSLGYDRFFVITNDGADGRMAVRVDGELGEKGRSSNGLE